jgi:dGTP triphosphohydrolase
MESHIFSIITALISGVITYLVARSGNKKDIELVKMQNNADMEKLMNQHKIDIEAMKEKHKLELELKEIEQKYKLEILKLENDNEIKKTTEIANNESMNTATNQIFGSIFGREVVQEQIDNAIKEVFNKTKVKGEENKNDN